MFDIDQNNNIIIKEPVVLMIKEFKTIWDKDSSKSKNTANKILAYIYFKYDFKSAYRRAYNDSELEAILKNDLELGKEWKETDEIIQAGKKYTELQISKSLKLLLSAEKAMEQIIKYFDSFDITKIASDKQADAINKLKNNIKDVDEVVGKLENAKSKVELELQSHKLSGTKVLSSRELPKNKRK